MADTVPAEERLFSLVLALIATEHGLTKAEILSSVQGYRQRYAPGRDNATLERQFERDKDDIRDLGVPLETVESPLETGNNQLLRYRIPKGAYDLPDEVTFTPEETTLLNLAAEVWREGSLSSESRRALLKLRSLGMEVDDSTIGYAPRVRVRDPAFDTLSEAIARHLVVRFAYLKPGESSATVRTVEPYALVTHEGRWHLSARDLGRDAMRNFLLSRITGAVTKTRTVFDAPDGDPAADAIAELDRVLAAGSVTVDVVPGSDAERRLQVRDHQDAPVVQGDGRRRLVVGCADPALIADEIASYGPEARVVEPASVRDAVIARLQRVAERHSDRRAH
ncbi:YafY family protein [Herbiconiux sp. L3-i23]|uniref:helix-turn-helix transcriptional regulator n=1 Tax=Herbiconiux sp. L3-i23 TaxID=2905871 RepID=UPI00206105EF|nr:WYL domain-containing protein [Herbiconiux sp. L3-i23]BDI22638.1 WYL domain-containing protein [Herbiconiux sp. L3-i23]